MNYFVKIRYRGRLPAVVLPFLLLPFMSLMFLLVPGLRSQTPLGPVPVEMQSIGALDRADIAREIDDPSSGARWLLVRSGNRPGGPGRMMLLSPQEIVAPAAALRELPAKDSYVPVIRAGDPVVVEEHTGVADARLQAVALGPARSGDTLRVRLNLGGRIVRAIATGPGRATLTPETEAWQ